MEGEMKGTVENSQTDESAEGKDSDDTKSEDDTHLRCKFFLTKKRRNCRMLRLSGLDFCAEHLLEASGDVEVKQGSLNDDERDVTKRQPCPYDPKHTVCISRLEKHLKKCNSKPPDKDYYLPSANSVAKPEDQEELNILTMPQEEKIDLIMQLIRFHRSRVPDIENHFGIHGYLMSDFVRSNIGESALRHSTQIGSIAKILDDHGLLKENTCFIEFGSGRGGLSFGLARVVKELGFKNCKFILIDRTSPRYKWDNRAKSDMKIERIKLSIEDLLVGKLPGIESYEHIVGITKHLCGSGTDVALRSLLEEKSNSQRSKVRGLVFATCCHHRTEYNDFVGNQFLPIEFSEGNFRPLRQAAAWATNGDYASSFIKDKTAVSGDTWRFFTESEKHYPEITLKKTVGRLVKEILDHCRAEHIASICTDIGLTCKLVNYVDLSTTRENVAILAYAERDKTEDGSSSSIS